MTEATPVIPIGDTQAHIDAMVAKVDGTQPPVTPVETPARPEWLPEKFATVEDMAKAYTALEQKQSTAKVTPTDEAAPVEGEAAKLTEELAGKGIDYDALSVEFQANGVLSDETYDKLSKAGMPKNIVDNYIAGQVALAAEFKSAAFAIAGDEAAYNVMSKWAVTNMSEAEQAVFNSAVESGNKFQMSMAVESLKSRFTKANGTEPALLSGAGAIGISSAYESKAQMIADMQDPRYQKDSAFRATVEAKLGRSNIF